MKKVLHLPTSVGGNPIGLRDAERRLGFDSRCLDIAYNNRFSYDVDIFPKHHSLHRFGVLGKGISLLGTFLSLRNQFDIYHFNCGHSIIDYANWGINYLDLPFYPKNKKIVFTFNGCDARQPTSEKVMSDISEWDEELSYNHLYADEKVNSNKRKRIAYVDQHADQIFTVNPDLLRFLPERTKFIPYTIAAWDKISTMKYDVTKKEKIKIIHAPTHRGLKGSKYVIAALEKLMQNYNHVEFKLVEGCSYEEALELYKQADLVIDQLMLGWYGALSVEVMKMGIPVMVFLRQSDLERIDHGMKQDCLDAFINVNPLNIYEKLAEFVENRTTLNRKSEAAVEFVYRWHEPIKIAREVSSFY